MHRYGEGSTTYSYDRADRITQAGTTSYTVDANGNLTAKGTDGFTYDQANRLKTASVGGTSSSYLYDGDGKRTSKTVGGSATNYVYDVNASLPVLLDDGTRKYVWGLGLAYAVDASGSPIVYHTDGLGSIRALTDVSGTVVQTYLYDEYGNVTSSTGSITQPFQYTGEQRDAETGLVYLRARYYQPSSGVFIQRDPIAGATASPGTLNRYSYTHGNPCARIDPSGLSAAESSCGTEPLKPTPFPSGVDVAANIRLVENMAAIRENPKMRAWLPMHITFAQLVAPRGEWDYKSRLGSEYENFGNWHFGVVAAAFGYSGYWARSGAGVAQIAQNIARAVSAISSGKSPALVPSQGLPFVTPPYGDDPADQAFIVSGMRWYEWYKCVRSQ